MTFIKWCEISKSALLHNFDQLNKLISSGTLILPVVKANAYGHGLSEVASVLFEQGVRFFGVNELDEALAIHSHFPKSSALILGFVPISRITEVVENGFHLVVYNKQTLLAIQKTGAMLNKIGFVHLKVETGNNRQGIDSDALEPFISLINSMPNIKIKGISTHFADIEDTTDHWYAHKQLAIFETCLSILKKNGHTPQYIHCANSAATILWPQTHFTLVRPGIALYGMWPSQETYITALQQHKKNIDLKPAITWKTRVAQVKNIKKGEYIGYGRTFRATHNMKIAVLPIGYYDGYDRKLSNIAYVLIKGERAPVVGRICMNMMMVEITHIPNVSIETEVVLLGGFGEEIITAEALAALAGTINYELTTRIPAHVPRIVVE